MIPRGQLKTFTVQFYLCPYRFILLSSQWKEDIVSPKKVLKASSTRNTSGEKKHLLPTDNTAHPDIQNIQQG